VYEYSTERRKFLSKFEGTYDFEFSTTDLARPDKPYWLTREFKDDIVIDLVKDNYYSLLGSVVHSILQRYAPADCVVEERIWVYLTIDGKRILLHGTPDLIDRTTKTLDDYKFTSGYAVLYDAPEYEQQLNINRFLAISNGHEVDRIRNIYMFRFLDPVAMQRNPDYPRSNIKPKEFTPWPLSVTERRIEELIRKKIRYTDTRWQDLPDCTDAERWIRDTKHAVYKRKNGTKKQPIQDWSSRAIGLFDTKEEAVNFINSSDIEQEMKIVIRKGEAKRCAEFCSVAQFCKQYQNELKETEGSILVD
jgi:hypothetical protein